MTEQVVMQGIETGPTVAPAIEFYDNNGERSQVRVLDVVLDVLPLPEDVNARRFIPKWDQMEATTCWDTPTVHLIRDMAIRLNGGIASRNEGPTGVSKSFAAEVICALTNRSYLRHNYSKEADVGDTIGRFVPSDSALAVRLDQLLAEPTLAPDARAIVEKAQAESRSLTVIESKLVASSLGINGLEDGKAWKWKNGTLTGSMMYGAVFGADERNLAPGSIMERENSALEKRPSLRLVEHEGEVIRGLSEDEQQIVDAGGIVPGVIGLDQKFWYVAAQNPHGIGGGRSVESEASRNRLQDRVVDALTPKEYEEFLTFLIKGKQPDIAWQNRRYSGARDVDTSYRDLEKIPNVDLLISWVSQFQSDLQQLAEIGKIGSDKDLRGGSYKYTRRNLQRFLDSFKAAQGALLDIPATLKEKRPVLNENPRDLVMEAINQEYLSGMYREDQDIVRELIKAAGIEELLGESKNNIELPKWVQKAVQNGIQVDQSSDGWTLRRSDVGVDGMAISDIDPEMDRDYEAVGSENGLIARRKLKSILEVLKEQENNVEATSVADVNSYTRSVE